jgi:FkbM family methyltransferase
LNLSLKLFPSNPLRKKYLSRGSLIRLKIPELLQTALKKVVRFPLYLWPNYIGVPILGGPLKGKLLPKETAQQNLQMWVGRYESIVVSELLFASSSVRIAYDIGAHVGYMTLVLAESVKKGGNVFAFEPMPDNYSLIEKLILLNGLNGKVCLLPLAFGDTEGSQRMVIRESSLMNQLETAASDKIVKDYPKIITAVSTLDSFVLRKSNPAPDLIKIDVEGAEGMVIAGGLQTLDRFSPKLLLEIHGPGNAGRTYELLEGLNYDWWRLRRAGSEKVLNKEHLLSFFSKYSWTHHFMVSREKEINEQNPLR